MYRQVVRPLLNMSYLQEQGSKYDVHRSRKMLQDAQVSLEKGLGKCLEHLNVLQASKMALTQMLLGRLLKMHAQASASHHCAAAS
eukprot:1146419-Pelagomonas_calceolata.AAC.10